MQIPFNEEQARKCKRAATHKKVLEVLGRERKGYVKFSVEKKNGKKRWIHAPHFFVKSAQKTILRNMPSPEVLQYDYNVITGFMPGMSIIDNARPHVKKRVVLSIDLHNFFPSFSPTEVKTALVGMPKVLDLVTTPKGRLPQGAPTSPMIANWLCVEGDKILSNFCTEHRMSYTRYADDLTFSSHTDIEQDVFNEILYMINMGIFGKRVKVAKDKIKFMRRHKQQRVTGIVVNEKLSIPRARRKQLRAFMHDAEINGMESALGRFNRKAHHIFGEFSFLHLAHKEQAEQYIEQFKELL